MGFRKKLKHSVGGSSKGTITQLLEEHKARLSQQSQHLVEEQGQDISAPSSTTQPASVPRYLRRLEQGSSLSQHFPQIVTFLVVAGSCLLVFWQLQPNLIFTRNTPTGGDMGAHVWGPDYLKDHIFSWWRHTGWAPDWYAGFPAFHFYMVVPYFLIAMLSLVIHYGVAFKLVAVSGAVLLPIAAWWLARKMGFSFPIPPLFALATVPFLFNDFQPTRIWGGTLPSLLAGEFAYSLSLLLAVLAIAVAMRGIRHGGLRLTGAVVLALVGLCHIIPAFYALASLALIVVVHDNRRAALRWLSVVVPLAGLLGAFWALPFWWRRDFFNDMGWEDNQDYLEVLLLGEYSSYWQWILVAAAAGVAATMVYRIRYGWFLIGSVVLWALVYRFPDLFPFTDMVLNGRIIPFYHLSLTLLAALGAGVLLWRLFGGDTKTFFSTGREGMRNVAPSNYRSQAQKSEAKIPSVPVFQFKARVVCLKLKRLFTLPNAIFTCLGLALVLVVIDSYSGRWLAESGFEHLLSVTGSEAERLAGDLAVFSRMLLLGVLLLVGVEVARRTLLFHRLQERNRRGWLTFGALAVAVIFFIAVAIPLRALGPFGVTGTVDVEVEKNGELVPERRQSYALNIPFLPEIGRTTEAANAVPGWARWNFSGYEGKPAFGEYQALIDTMNAVGEEYGCGRAMWEYDRDPLTSYGTTMAPMLLPYWSDGCIGSMEGLYFESSATVPYHFLNQSELSSPRDADNPMQGPSRAMRDIPYRNFNIDTGIRHLQLLGVRYYLTINETATNAARNHPDLTEIGSPAQFGANGAPTTSAVVNTSSWNIFLIADSPLVEPLDFEPVVWNNVSNGQDSWLEPATSFYNGDDFSVLPASSGPDSWQRIPAATSADGLSSPPLPRTPLPEVEVANISASDNSISFSVDRIGVPVLVKVSYFPNWQASGADGPWRVAPNLMVVIPTSENVKLTYGWTPVDIFAYLLTGLGVLIVVLLAWRPSLISWGRFPGPKEQI